MLLQGGLTEDVMVTFHLRGMLSIALIAQNEQNRSLALRQKHMLICTPYINRE